MSTRHPAARRLLRYAPLVLMLCLFAAPAAAQAPDATMQRIVELNVQMNEARYLRNSRQIDSAAFSVRRRAIDAELDPLVRALRRLPAAEFKRIDSELDGLIRARLSTLEPQWAAKAEQAEKEREQHDLSVRQAITADARTALEPQRQRLILQQRRDRGEITPEEFAASDQKALDEIMALRGKYSAEGDAYTRRFDRELELLTQAIAKDPATPVPTSKVAAGTGGTSPADYQRDVVVAADILGELNEVGNRHWVKKEIPIETLRESGRIYTTDLSRLTEKWRKVGKADDFERDYRQRMAGAAPGASPANAGATTASRSSATGLNPGWILFGFVGLGTGGVIYVLYRLSRPGPPPPHAVSDVHGTAHYAPLQLDITDAACLSKGLFFGKSSVPRRGVAPLEDPGAPVCSTPEHHTLIVARTRTGKGTRVIVPTLLRYGGSALVIDPKGENAAITAAMRRDQLGQHIHILNPWNELASTYERGGFTRATYNPLDILDRTDPNVVAIAQTLAGAICPSPANAKDRFWQGSAANVLTAVFLWLTNEIGEQKTLGRAREIVSLTRKEFTAKYLVRMAASDAFSGAIREFSAPFIDLADETYSGVMSNLSESTKFLSDPQVKAATARSSFSMGDLASQKATVYVVIPTERMDTQKTWLRLVIAAAMHVFKHPQATPVYGHRCLFLIDEFAALGRLDDLPRDIATMSGFGVDFALIVQGLDQLKDHYAEARGTILSNCAYKWFCNVNDLDSAKYLSDTLGKATVSTTSSSDSYSQNPGGGGASQSTTRSETGRNLLNPDEVLNLGRDVAIVIQPNGHPHYLRPVDYWTLPDAFGSLREKHPDLYWEPPLGYDDNPYFAAPPPPPPGGSGGETDGKGNAEASPRRGLGSRGSPG